MLRAGLVVVLGLSACGKSKQECQQSAHELGTLLEATDHTMPLWVDPQLHRARRDDLGHVPAPPGPVIELRAAAVAVNGEPMDDDARLAEQLAALHARPAGVLNVVVDEAATWATVARVAQASYQAGFDQLAFELETTPSAVPAPPRNWVDDKLDAIQQSTEAGNKATELAALAEKVVRSCKPLARAFGSVVDTGEDKAEMLIKAIEPALVECECDLDVPALRSIMYRLLHVEHPTTSLQVTLAPGRPPLALPAATPWRDANRQLTPATKVVWLDVAR